MAKRSVTEVARNFSAVVTRVAVRGERVELVRAGRILAALVPAPQGLPAGLLQAALTDMPRLGRREAIAMARTLRTGRARLREPRSAWDS